MQIGSVIRKYRKERNLTQEEMAKRLGVTAPAVNKWEKGVSLPDISFLAPIARLLNITLDELLCFQEDLTAEEISDMIKELDHELESKPYEEVFLHGSRLIHEYPGCHQLIWQIALFLHANMTERRTDSDPRQAQIETWYLQALESNDAQLRKHAAGSLFQYYLSREEYEKAESYISYFSEESAERKRKMALIYSKTNRKKEAYKAYEEILFSEYQMLNLVLNSLFLLSMEEKNSDLAKMWMEKESGLARLFDMGVYREECCKLELAAAQRDRAQTYSSVRKMLGSLDQLCSAFTESDMYRHMKFSEPGADFYEKLRGDLLQKFRDDETFSYMKGHAEWEMLTGEMPVIPNDS